VRIINTTGKPLTNLRIRATHAAGQSLTTSTDPIMPRTVRKVKYQIPEPAEQTAGEVQLKLELLDKSNRLIDQIEIKLRQVSPTQHHERTFVSQIDGSIQYYSIAPAIRTTPSQTKAMILTLHGAGVEARNQARSYKPKDLADIIAPTNRRPYGFNWEEWGRIDALEVLEEAKRIFHPDTSRIYLTGHSMGGHGTWVIGTTHPDHFAAIAPCASYPDILTYGRQPDQIHYHHPAYQIIERSAHPGRIPTLIHNLKQTGIYLFHGDADRVVPTQQARQMRQTLSEFHPNFCYYEYPGGEHWFGNLSMDWPPIFEYFARHTIPPTQNIRYIDFQTYAPSVSSTNHWIRLIQQTNPFEHTHLQAERRQDTLFIQKAENASLLEINLPALAPTPTEITLSINHQTIPLPPNQKALLAQENGQWHLQATLNPHHKTPERYGGFKQAFNHHLLLVYATQGSREENEWYQNKARFDAETFYYRANGSIDVIPDTDYTIAKYPDRSVILYGNSTNHRAWPLLLKECPIQVTQTTIKAGSKTLTGPDLSACFIYPHPSSTTALVGVIAGTGKPGMRATAPNNYFSGITGYPDILIYRADLLRTGLEAVEIAGYFANDWSLPLTPQNLYLK
jgi:predicted esterase